MTAGVQNILIHCIKLPLIVLFVQFWLKGSVRVSSPC